MSRSSVACLRCKACMRDVACIPRGRKARLSRSAGQWHGSCAERGIVRKFVAASRLIASISHLAASS
eukprot:4736115-Lingulodinium_polyedra.AAC.1